MNGDSGGSSNSVFRPARASPSDQPRKVSSVPEVSFQPNTAAVTATWCSPKPRSKVASSPPTFTSSPIQLFMAEALRVSVVVQPTPVCSSDTGG